MSQHPSKAECFAAFHAASRCLEQAGIRHWIDFGTLLGAVREGGFIACDQDVDFNFFSEDLPRFLDFRQQFARDLGLELIFDRAVNTVRLLPRHPQLRLTTDEAANRSCIDALVPYADFYPCWTDGKWLRHPVGEYDFRSIYCRTLERIIFEGRLFPCPQNPLSLLLHRYGPNWPSPLDRFEFDAQARSLIWPFPERLGCLLLATGDVSLDALVAFIAQLQLDFDHVVTLLPENLLSLLTTAIVSLPPTVLPAVDSCELITPSVLASLGCHFVMAVGLSDPFSRLSSGLFEADVVLFD